MVTDWLPAIIGGGGLLVFLGGVWAGWWVRGLRERAQRGRSLLGQHDDHRSVEGTGRNRHRSAEELGGFVKAA